MTAIKFRQWLETHYGRGQRLAFVTDYNAVAADMGDAPITLDALENWLYRQPPQGRRLEQTLDLVLAYREHEKPIVKTYTLNVPVTAEREQLVREMAGDGEYAPEVFLRAMVNRALESEIEGYLTAIRESKKRPRGRPAKPILIRPEVETEAPASIEPKPKPRRGRSK